MDIANRFRQNSLLSPKDVKPSMEGMQVECILNPGVFKFNNKIYLLVRVAERPIQKEGKVSFPIYNKQGKIELLSFDKDHKEIDLSDPRVIVYKGQFYLTTLSHLALFSSNDGINFTQEELRLFGEGEQETFGIEDCRVTTMSDGFHLTYTKVSAHAVGVGYMFTKDWQNFERRGMIFPPHNKDCAIFEEKINGLYYALHRPSSPELGGNYMWLAQSPDLLHWGNHQLIATTRKNMWDSQRLGAGAAPIKTSEGWLEIYHGANANHRYCLGAILLELNNPQKVIARSTDPIMEPIADYEQTGFFGNVVFTNGHIVDEDIISLYYGASDEYICGANLSIKQILNSLK
jgi:predicted GH43/DUF377 family glycosyl hydrolase